MMSTIAHSLKADTGWEVYNLNSTVDMVNQFAAKLSENPLCAKQLVLPKGVNLSIATISLGFEYNKEQNKFW